MDSQSIPEKAKPGFLEGASERDRTTNRRLRVFKLLWRERFLTRARLIARYEGVMGQGCIGEKAWDDTFYRDMPVIKKAFKRVGSSLKCRRSREQPG
jgi:hypothetical protein